MNALRSLCTLLAVLVLFCCAACRQTDIRTAEIRVPQVRNAACEQRVRAQLAELRGLQTDKLVFDLRAGTLTVTYDSMQLARKNIEHAIIAAGFDANELKADPKAAAALPPECMLGAVEKAPDAAAPAPAP